MSFLGPSPIAGTSWHDYYCNNPNEATDVEKNAFFLNNFLSENQRSIVKGILGTLEPKDDRITQYRRLTNKMLIKMPALAYNVPGWSWPAKSRPLLLAGRAEREDGQIDGNSRLRLHYLQDPGFFLIGSSIKPNIDPHKNNPLAAFGNRVNDHGVFLGPVSIDGNNNLTIEGSSIEDTLGAFSSQLGGHKSEFINKRDKDPEHRPYIPKIYHENPPENDEEGNGPQPPPPPPQTSPITNMNTIFYGPPGTGKTYTLSERALQIIEGNEAINESPNDRFTSHVRSGRIEFTTFHQNYAYEDFIEGLRAEYDATHQAVVYRIEAGILKRIAYRALYAWLTGETPGFELTENQNGFVKSYLQHGTLPDGFAERQIPNFVLIIDEINRGNVARIFGELITLVEDSKRARRPGKAGDGHQPLLATLPYTKEPFILPPNLYLVGTMNTADRSLIGLDAALRRRFVFEEMPPLPEKLSNSNVEGINLGAFLTQLNQRIRERDTRDHCIGHAYFMGVSSLDQLAGAMRNKVIPQLQEYFHDRPEELHDLLTVGNVSFVDEQGQTDENAVRAAASYRQFIAV